LAEVESCGSGLAKMRKTMREEERMGWWQF